MLARVASRGCSAVVSFWPCSKRHLHVDGWQPQHKKRDQQQVDKAVVVVAGGKGGAGCTSTYKPSPGKLIADGGNGGIGGDVVVEADESVQSFASLATSYAAGSGGHGSSHAVKGGTGGDVVIKVPVTTSVRLFDKLFAQLPQLKEVYHDMADAQAEAAAAAAGSIDERVSEDAHHLLHRFEKLRRLQQNCGAHASPVTPAKLAGLKNVQGQHQRRKLQQRFEADAAPFAFLHAHGERCVVARGARGGLGNAAYASRAYGPASMFSQHGGAPEAAALLLERKLLADVALVGFPNAGKSSLLRALTRQRAQPRVAHYAFTTLAPQLGALPAAAPGTAAPLVADLPGLVQGAHQDRGLGHDFLRHLENVQVLAYVLDLAPNQGSPSASADTQHETSALQQLHALQAEIGHYNAALHAKHSLVVLSKTDLLPDQVAVDAAIADVRNALSCGSDKTVDAAGNKSGHGHSDGLQVLPEVFAVSSITGHGVSDLEKHLQQAMQNDERGIQAQDYSSDYLANGFTSEA